MERIRLTGEERQTILEHLKDSILAAKTRQDLGDLKLILEPIKENKIKKPIFFIKPSVKEKMKALVQTCDTEVQWHGLIKHDPKTNTFLLYDLILFPQEVSYASCTTDQDEYTKWQLDRIKDPDFPLKNLRFHGHSHVNMSVFSSDIDNKYQKDLTTNIDDYYVFMILNKKGEIYITIYDFIQNIKFETKDIQIETLLKDQTANQWAKKELDKYLKKKTWSSYTTEDTKKKKKTKYNYPKFEYRGGNDYELE